MHAAPGGAAARRLEFRVAERHHPGDRRLAVVEPPSLQQIEARERIEASDLRDAVARIEIGAGRPARAGRDGGAEAERQELPAVHATPTCRAIW